MSEVAPNSTNNNNKKRRAPRATQLQLLQNNTPYYADMVKTRRFVSTICSEKAATTCQDSTPDSDIRPIRLVAEKVSEDDDDDDSEYVAPSEAEFNDEDDLLEDEEEDDNEDDEGDDFL